jgi:hopanoid biosynthesis associated protein HpnK
VTDAIGFRTVAVAEPRFPILILTADDFGASARVNAAIARAHREGVLACASLMINGPAAAEAVALARACPELRVGLHLVVVDGRSALEPERVPGIVDRTGRFPASPLLAGLRYGLRPGARAQLAEEIRAQFDRFGDTGLSLDHVTGHHHLHMHPVLWPLVMAEAERHAADGIRVTRDDLGLSAAWSRRGLGGRAAHAAIFAWLAQRSRRELTGRRLHWVSRVYGVLQGGGLTEAYLLWLVNALPSSDAEIIFHPGARAAGSPEPGSDQETQALTSPALRATIVERGFQVGGYTDLQSAGAGGDGVRPPLTSA